MYFVQKIAFMDCFSYRVITNCYYIATLLTSHMFYSPLRHTYFALLGCTLSRALSAEK